MSANEHGKPDLETVRARLLDRAASLGLNDGESENWIIERVLDLEVPESEPAEEECRRYYEQNARRFAAGELVEASHILLAMTPRVPPDRLRAKAAEVHAMASRDAARFAELAREYSNCPSAAQGGSLGQIGRGDMVPEFERALLGGELLSLLPDLVATRFGFHVVLVARRIPGRVLAYEQARPMVAAFLRERAAARALGEYVRGLATQPRAPRAGGS